MKTMKKHKKITVLVRADLLAAAQSETGAGITETVRLGLERLRRAYAYRQLRELRGKVKFDLPLREIREDRR
jgi:hypothetical protein